MVKVLCCNKCTEWRELQRQRRWKSKEKKMDSRVDVREKKLHRKSVTNEGTRWLRNRMNFVIIGSFGPFPLKTTLHIFTIATIAVFHLATYSFLTKNPPPHSDRPRRWPNTVLSHTQHKPMPAQIQRNENFAFIQTFAHSVFIAPWGHRKTTPEWIYLYNK